LSWFEQAGLQWSEVVAQVVTTPMRSQRTLVDLS